MIGYGFGSMLNTQVIKIALDSVRDGLKLITEKIIEEAITTMDPDIIGISSMLDAKDEENSEGMCTPPFPLSCNSVGGCSFTLPPLQQQ